MTQPWQNRQPSDGYGRPDPYAASPGRQPLGRQPLRGVDIESYAPPRATGGWLVWLLACVVLAGIVLAGILLPAPAPAGTATPGPTASPAASAGSGLPFTMPSNPEAGGRWEILDQQWTGEGVVLQVRLFADAGTISYGFVAFQNRGVDVVEPTPGPKTPRLTRGTMQATTSTTGYVFLPLDRGAATLILTTSGGRQISALPIAG